MLQALALRQIITRFMVAVFAVFAVMYASSAMAQLPPTPIVTAELISDVEVIEKDTPFWVGLKLTIQKDWHTYWQNPGDSGIPLSLEWQAQQGVTLSPLHWPLPERQPYSGLVNYGYSHQLVLPVAVTLDRAVDTLTLHAKASWLVCKDICIPESQDVSITLPVSGDTGPSAALLETSLTQLPKPVDTVLTYEVTGEQARIAIPKGALPKGARIKHLFPIEDGIIQNAAKQFFRDDENGFLLETTAGGLHENRGTIKAVLAYEHAGVLKGVQFGAKSKLSGALTDKSAASPAVKTESEPSPADNVTNNITLWAALGLAFLGGLLLNLMPCVLPIVALKALSIAKKSDVEKRDAAIQGIAYTLGVLCTMALLGAGLFALKLAGESAGWGFQLQSPAMVVSLSLLMLLVGMFLLGWFQLPSLFTRADQTLGNQHGATGSFFTGALSVAVATPCTAPFMAPALGAAAALPFAEGILILLSLGLGLAAPYLLISVWPPARAVLPKPGAWMETFKQALAFPMFATAAWLLWVLVHLNGAQGLGYALIGFVLLGFAVWLHAHSNTRFWRVIALITAIAAVTFAVKSQPEPLSADAKHQAVMEGGVTQLPYSADKLQQLRDQGKSVLVDATAAWCITCKINEQVALRDETVQRYFKEHDITLMIADWTMRDAAITDYLAKFNRNGVPLYVWYAKGQAPEILPQVLTPSIVLGALRAQSDTIIHNKKGF